LDVGCGEGWWAYWAKKSGLAEYVVGIDHDGFKSLSRAELDDWVDLDFMMADEHTFVGEQFDMTICLEMAEHLPAIMADDLVKFLCDSSKEYILFSAAIPGQGGMGHINEQWPNYWLDKFNALGWYGARVMRFWDNKSVEPWYAQNMVLLEQDGVLTRNLNCEPMVHPAFWSTRTGVHLP
jgi:SAM-dependent methyltransferase